MAVRSRGAHPERLQPKKKVEIKVDMRVQLRDFNGSPQGTVSKVNLAADGSFMNADVRLDRGQVLRLGRAALTIL